MSITPFTLRIEPEVEAFLAGLAPAPRRQVQRDLEKLASRGMQALPPLIAKSTGPVWELRSRVEGHGRFRLFYYRDGETSFHVFIRKGTKMPRLWIPFRKKR